ncbi:MAG: hypothetical protein RXQ94_04150 [Caldivirga sp.]
MPNTQDADNQEPNKDNGNTATKQQQAVQELLEKLGIPTQPTQPTGCAADSTGGVSVAQGCETDVAKQQTEGLAVVAQAHAFDLPKQQLTAPATAAAQTPGGGGGSVVVNCRYCGGCCGGLSGRRLPARVVELVRLVKEVLGLKYECEVLNRWPEVFCQRVRVRRSRVKARERDLSRAVQFKASYLLGVVKHAGDVGEVVERLRLAFEDYLSYRGGGDVDGFINGLLHELGFASLRELALYLWWLLPSEVYGIMVGLVDFVEATRRGWVNIIKLRCRLRHSEGDVTEIPTTVDLPTFIRLVVRHFRHVHGLATWRDVAKAVLEAKKSREASRPEGDDVGVKLLRYSAAQLQLDRLIIHRLVDVKLLDRIGKKYWCRVCSANVGGVIEAIDHVLNHHYDVVNRLFSGKPTPSVDGFNDAVDELANMFSSGNPDAVKPTVKALVKGIIDIISIKGSTSMLMLTRELANDDDYRLLLGSLATGGMKPERVVAMIVEVMARHGIVQVDGGVVRLGE